jgi:septal ring factor EnvC (AmiA/AmiB activator)
MADKPQPAQKTIPEPPKPQEKAPSPALQQVTREIDEILRHLKLLEERHSGVRKKSQFIEQNMLKETKEIFDEITLLRATISDVKSDISEINEKLEKLTEEVNSAVKKTEFNVLVKYLDFWQPLGFITKDEALKIIADSKKE